MFHIAYNCYVACKNRSLRQNNFALVGLPNGGKSTMKFVLSGELEPLTIPTIGQTKPVEIKRGSVVTTVFDLGGGNPNLWMRYYHKLHGIIWVVDAADPASFKESARELRNLLRDPKVQGKPILVFANKQDLPAAVSEVEIATGLGLDDLQTSAHKIVKCIALPEKNGGREDPALRKGIRWLEDQVRTEYEKINIRVISDTETFDREAEAVAQKRAERAAKAKEDRRLAREAAEAAAAAGEKVDKPKKKKPKKKIECKVTYARNVGSYTQAITDRDGNDVFQCQNAAVKKSSLWKWKPVCEACEAWLIAGKPELDAQGNYAAASTDAQAPAATTTTGNPASAAAESDTKAPRPESDAPQPAEKQAEADKENKSDEAAVKTPGPAGRGNGKLPPITGATTSGTKLPPVGGAQPTPPLRG